MARNLSMVLIGCVARKPHMDPILALARKSILVLTWLVACINEVGLKAILARTCTMGLRSNMARIT